MNDPIFHIHYVNNRAKIINMAVGCQFDSGDAERRHVQPAFSINPRATSPSRAVSSGLRK
jgi:hypothetical protein